MVIGIIGLLAAIITPVVMQSLAKARNAAIKAEIDMLHMAIMNYKNEYGIFPPCSTGTFGISGNDPASRHLARIFPRISTGSAQAKCLPYVNNPPGSINAAGGVTPDTAIVAWLFGYTTDPTFPVLGPLSSFSLVAGSPGTITIGANALQRKKLYDFDTSRLHNYQYHPSAKPNAPYIYIASSQYGLAVPNTTRFSLNLAYSGTNASELAAPGTQFVPADPLPAKPSGYPDAWWFTNATGSQQPFNLDTFQILCAGRDEQFGTDDDLSNFWPGTRREYLESLKDQ